MSQTRDSKSGQQQILIPGDQEDPRVQTFSLGGQKVERFEILTHKNGETKRNVKCNLKKKKKGRAESTLNRGLAESLSLKTFFKESPAPRLPPTHQPLEAWL